MDRIGKLKELLASGSADSFVRHALALEYIKAGNDEEARALFESVLEKDENYVGSYYHLAKLLERTGRKGEAEGWYEKGMQKAREAGDDHSYNELRSAYEELTG